MEFSINEALELALEAIDKETKTAKNSNNNNQNKQQHDNNDNINIDDEINKIVMMNQQQHEMMNRNETTNKTDEEKELKSKLKQTKLSNSNNEDAATASATMIKQEQQHIANTTAIVVVAAKNNEQNEEDEDQELRISKEPIYENISTTSTHKVDADAKIIPNTINNNINNININNNNKNNQNICKATNSNNSHNNSINNSNINNNNNNFNEITTTTTAFANKTTAATATATAAAITTAATTADTAENQSTATTLLSTTSTTTTTSAKANAITTTQKTKTTTIVMSIEQQQEQQLLQLTQNEATLMTHQQQQQHQEQQLHDIVDPEPYYQVPKSSEPYYDAPKHLRPVPVYENIDVFYSGLENSTLSTTTNGLGMGLGGIPFKTLMEPPKEKPPPPPIESPPPSFDGSESIDNTDTWSSDNTYETISSRRLPQQHQHNGLAGEHPSPPIKRMNSTKRIKKELRNKRSSFLGIEGSLDDDDTYLELTVAPPPDMAQLLQEERRLEKQLYMKAGLCDSSDTGESRDSGVSENHSRQSSEHYTNSSEENDRHGGVDTPPHSLKSNEVIYQNEALLTAAQTPLLQTVKGNSAESWTESATVAAAATKSLTEATATANAKMLSIEEKIREQEEVLRVERELLQLEQEELKRQRENLMLRENMARRELQHGAKMLMSANRRSLQDLNGVGMTVADGSGGVNGVAHTNGIGGGSGSGGGIIYQQIHNMPMQQKQQLPLQHQHQQQQQIYANVPNIQEQYYHQVETDYRKSMSDLNEFSKRLMIPPTPPTKPMRQPPAMHVLTATTTAPMLAAMDEFSTSRQRHSLNTQSYGGSLVKIANAQPSAASRSSGHVYSNYHHQSAQNLSSIPVAAPPNNSSSIVMNGHAAATSAAAIHHGNMSRNTLHALSATPKPKYTDGWVQVQNRKAYDTNLANDPAWLSAYQQKRKSMPDAYHAYNNHWLVQEAEQRRMAEQQQRRSVSSGNTPVHQQNGGGGGGVNILKVNNNHNSATVTAMNNNGKPLPDSIIQTLTERVQSKGIGERKRFDNFDKSPLHAASSYHQQQQHHLIAAHRHINDMTAATKSNNIQNATATTAAATMSGLTTTTATSSMLQQQDKVLSVSGKKKCSHCGDELGRGAAMIIESLLLFYHINCFKCCVCHVQLGDGLNGTDVRVRNHKLHCQNCYSSDDGIKFSCV